MHYSGQQYSGLFRESGHHRKKQQSGLFFIFFLFSRKFTEVFTEYFAFFTRKMVLERNFIEFLLFFVKIFQKIREFYQPKLFNSQKSDSAINQNQISLALGKKYKNIFFAEIHSKSKKKQQSGLFSEIRYQKVSTVMHHDCKYEKFLGLSSVELRSGYFLFTLLQNSSR